MSEQDGTEDPYRTPPAGPSATPSTSRPRADQTHGVEQPYGTQHYGTQPYGTQPYRTQQPFPQPPAVVRLRQVMLSGAVAALLQGGYALLVVDDLLAVSAPELEQVARDSGMDAARFAEMTGTAFTVGVVVSTLLTAGLWLLFARLFDQGRARVPGTVLGALNGATLLLGLFAPDDLVAWLLTVLSSALVVAGLVLLWRPAASAWFGAVAASRTDRL